MNLETVERLSNILILHLKLISILKSWLAFITMGIMTKYTIFINFGQKYTRNELNDPLVVAMGIYKPMKLSIIDFILCLKLMFSG